MKSNQEIKFSGGMHNQGLFTSATKITLSASMLLLKLVRNC